MSSSAPPWVTGVAAIAVVLAWLAALTIGALEQDWTPLTITTPVMMLLGGYAFGIQIIHRQSAKAENGESQK